MSERLPDRVVCSSCGEIFPIDQTRRKITLWARPRKGGSLSGIKDQQVHDVYRCNTCIREGRTAEDDPAQEALL